MDEMDKDSLHHLGIEETDAIGIPTYVRLYNWFGTAYKMGMLHIDGWMDAWCNGWMGKLRYPGCSFESYKREKL